jgi:hypothetical protein
MRSDEWRRWARETPPPPGVRALTKFEGDGDLRRGHWRVQERLLARDFVVSAPEELNETEPVAEGINHQCQPTPFAS